jgi:hypothetical protein
LCYLCQLGRQLPTSKLEEGFTIWRPSSITKSRTLCSYIPSYATTLVFEIVAKIGAYFHHVPSSRSIGGTPSGSKFCSLHQLTNSTPPERTRAHDLPTTADSVYGHTSPDTREPATNTGQVTNTSLKSNSPTPSFINSAATVIRLTSTTTDPCQPRSGTNDIRKGTLSLASISPIGSLGRATPATCAGGCYRPGTTSRS